MLAGGVAEPRKPPKPWVVAGIAADWKAPRMSAPTAAHFPRKAFTKIFLVPSLKPSPACPVLECEYTVYVNWSFVPHIFLKDCMSFLFFFLIMPVINVTCWSPDLIIVSREMYAMQ